MPDKKITLAENGKAAAIIVVADGSDTIIDAAVQDMVRVIAKMSGAALPVVRDGDGGDAGTQVHIGPTRLVSESAIIPDGLPVNGCRLASLETPSGRALAIVGSTSLGTSHGVYTLLSDVLGVVWGMADSRFEEVPTRATIVVEPLDRTEVPTFGFRVWSGNHPDYVRRNRVDNGSRMLPYYGHGHNLFSIVPPSKCADHPEYYALLPPRGEDGPLERRVPEEDGHTHIQPCLSNPDVIRITIETVREYFDANPDVSTYSLCPNDSGDFCQCEGCLALDDGMPEYRGRRMNSDSYFYYIEAVSRELMKSHPDRYVGVYAYWTTELPPRNIARLEPNVVVYLTQDTSQYFDEAYERRDHELLEAWSKVAHHLAIYCYYGLGWFPPRVYTDVAARTIPYLPTVSVKGFYCETYPYWPHIAPQLYLASRLLWDASLDAEEVLDGWFSAMFHEAADEMREYWRILERGWMNPREGKWFQGLDWLAEQLRQVPADARDAAWEQINRALGAAKSDLVRDRISYVLTGNKLAYLLSKSLEQAHALDAKHPDLAERIDSVLARIEEAEHVYRTEIETDECYGAAYYRGERGDMQIWWLQGHIASIIDDVLAKNAALRDALASDAVLSRMREVAEYPDIPRRIKESREMYGVA